MATNPLLTFDNISHQYPGATQPVLHNVCLSVCQGEFVMITGPSGTGKSTFLQIGALLDRASKGQLLFEGECISQLSDRALSRIRAVRFGMVFQAYHLLHGRSVLDNVMFRFRYLPHSRKDCRQLSQSALDAVGLSHLMDKPVRLLSGGEMQRVALARAIAAQPRIVFADEPTGNLDRKTTSIIMTHLENLNLQGLTIVMVTHDESLLCKASHCYHINNARLQAHECVLS